VSALYVITHIDAMPPYTETATDLLRAHTSSMRGAAGVERAELLEQLYRKNHFELLTVFTSEVAYDAHVSTAETVAFREQLHPMLGSPIDDRIHHLLEDRAEQE
jgi:quinol monooxygenase YgiN